MSKTESKMVPLGSLAPRFELADVVTGKIFSLNEEKKYLGRVLMFICNHCPYVKHINACLSKLAYEYMKKNIQFIAISSNDAINYPADSPENMRQVAQAENYPFPYLYDESQDIARAFNAACTPDFFIYDQDLCLVYRGQFDDSRPGNQIEVSGNSIREVLDCLLEKKPIPSEQKPSIGCNIKWKS